mmetsp:Transcript_51127/g.101740  ORF Transcript_51127/g.101740 Transcript_51127/m.101740 type:complete len:81 (-) Transcript_51127:275-517(-)
MSYYNNAPRLLTPSILKTTKTTAPLESVRFEYLEPASSLTVNTSHMRRGSSLQYQYPSTYARLRQVEREKAAAELLRQGK